MLKAVLFDLDGTLLPIDTEKFMEEYVKEIASNVSEVVPPEHFKNVLMSSTYAMMKNTDPSVKNYDVFWEEFRAQFRDYIEFLIPLIEDFYENKFYCLGKDIKPSPYSRKAVETALKRGLKIIIATNPIFPLSAIKDRMKWAGIADLSWELITSYENMHFCKPQPEYFHEITEQLGITPKECIMVGNDARDDLVPARIGMYTCLIKDFLVNASKTELQAHWSGTMEELVELLENIDLEKGIAV